MPIKVASSMRPWLKGCKPIPETGVEEGNISTLPKMELEKMDTSIQSARKITVGIKSMMEGFGGLKDLAPPPAMGGN